MLPAIAVILWCNLLAVLGNGYLKVIALEVPAKRAKARSVFVSISVISLGLASWQTAEVALAGFQARGQLENLSRPQQSNPTLQKVEQQSQLKLENCRQEVQFGISAGRIGKSDEIEAIQDCLMGSVQ